MWTILVAIFILRKGVLRLFWTTHPLFSTTMFYPLCLFFSLTFSFLNDTWIFSHFSNPGQSKNYVSCIPRIPFKLQFVEKWHFLTFALQFVWPFSFLERCGTNIFMSQFLWHHGFFERSRVVAGRGASEEVSAVGFCLGSGLFGSYNSD